MFVHEYDECLLGATAVIVVAVISLVVVLPVGVLLGCCSLWCLMRQERGERKSEHAEPVVIPLSQNQAYASVNQIQRRN